MIYRGFTVRNETEIDYYSIATRGDTTILVDFDKRTYRNEIPLSQAIEEATGKLYLLIDAWHRDPSILNRLPKEWRDGYKYDEVSASELHDAIDRLIPSPGQLTLADT